MAAPVVADILMEARAIVYNTLRPLFFDTGTSVEFLKPTTNADRAFDLVDVLFTGWFLKYNNFRKEFLLEVAGPEDWMQNVMETSTHIKVDDDIYVIRRSDTLPPKGVDVTWKIYCERFTTRAQFGTIY
jgi:hypothetical protein